MHLSKLWRGVAVASVACGLAATGAASASAASATATVTITPATQFAPVTHDYFVLYGLGKGGNAVTLSGTVTDAASGEVAALYAQQFPFRKAPVPVKGQTLTLTGAASTSYNFTARPTLATKYTVKVLTSAGATTTDGVSATQIVYVATYQPFTWKTCSRPVCHESMKVYTHLPSSAYKTEVGKKWYFYWGLALSTTTTPAPPKWLYLDTKATISKPKKISSTEFERTITWSFRIGNDGYYPLPNFCSKDTEYKDGVNLPGSHGCGAKRVRSTTEYLG